MLTTALIFGAGVAIGMVLAVLLAMASEYHDWTTRRSDPPAIPMMSPPKEAE